MKHFYLIPKLIHPKQLSSKTLAQLQNFYGKFDSLTDILRANRTELTNLERQRLNGNRILTSENLTTLFESTQHSIEFLQQFGDFLKTKTHPQGSQAFIAKTGTGKYLRELSPADRGLRNLERCRKNFQSVQGSSLDQRSKMAFGELVKSIDKIQKVRLELIDPVDDFITCDLARSKALQQASLGLVPLADSTFSVVIQNGDKRQTFQPQLKKFSILKLN